MFASQCGRVVSLRFLLPGGDPAPGIRVLRPWLIGTKHVGTDSSSARSRDDRTRRGDCHYIDSFEWCAGLPAREVAVAQPNFVGSHRQQTHPSLGPCRVQVVTRTWSLSAMPVGCAALIVAPVLGPSWQVVHQCPKRRRAHPEMMPKHALGALVRGGTVAPYNPMTPPNSAEGPSGSRPPAANIVSRTCGEAGQARRYPCPIQQPSLRRRSS
jgi:hypothetical protein